MRHAEHGRAATCGYQARLAPAGADAHPQGRPGRRSLLAALATLPLGGAARETYDDFSPTLLPGRLPFAPWGGAAPEDLAEWEAFKARYIRPEGRAVDTGNGGISHSEGQGFTLLLAESMDDRATFERALDWTRQNLRRRGDALLAWRWKPGVPRPTAEDLNNATDGDLLVAWALLRGASRWGVPGWRAEAREAIATIRRRLVLEVAGQLVLLPGLQGFTHAGHVVVNPSYLVFGALRAFAAADDRAFWRRVEADGLALLRQARFGRWRLPADWVSVSRSDGRVAPAEGWPPRFSWDAIRVPLYLAWAGLHGEPPLAAAASFWTDAAHDEMPAWADLRSGAVSPYAATAGVAAIAGLSVAAASGRPPNRALLARMLVAEAPDYYGAALVLLTRLAAREGWVVPTT